MKSNKTEKVLKRFLKRKLKITLGLIVTFMITGLTTFSEDSTTSTSPNKAFGNLADGKIFDFEGYKGLKISEDKIYTMLSSSMSSPLTTWSSARGYEGETVFNGNIKYKNDKLTFFTKVDVIQGKFVYDGILEHINQLPGSQSLAVTFYANNTKEFRNNGLIFYTFDDDIDSTEIATSYVLYNDSPKEKFINNGYILGEGRLSGMGNSSNVTEMSNNGFISLKAYEESYGMFFLPSAKTKTINNMKNNGVITGEAALSNEDGTATIQDLLNGMKVKSMPDTFPKVDYLVNNGMIILNSKETNGYLAGININTATDVEKIENNGKIDVKQISFGNDNGKIDSRGIFLKYQENSPGNNNLYNNGTVYRRLIGKRSLSGVQNMIETGAIVLESETLNLLSNKGIASSITIAADPDTTDTSNYSSIGISMNKTSSNLNELNNSGIISGINNIKENGFGVAQFYSSKTSKSETLNNKGIIMGSSASIYRNESIPENLVGTNLGLFITKGENIFAGGSDTAKGQININNHGLYIKVLEDGTHQIVDEDMKQITAAKQEVDTANKVINGEIKDSKVQSIDLTGIDLSTGYTFNGFDKTLNIKDSTVNIKDSVINAYKTAVNLDGGTAEFKNTIINGGLDTIYDKKTGETESETAAIKGEDNKDNKLTLINSTVNGKIEFGNGNDILEVKRDETSSGFNYLNKDINMGAGNDTLSISSNTYINEGLDGGTGKDSLTLGDVYTSNEDKNKYAMEIENNAIRIFGEVKNFEDINIKGQVHLYETGKITAENKDGKIHIDNNSSLNVRIDPSKVDGNIIIGHGLYDSGYTITGKGALNEGEYEGNTSAGTLNFVTNGIGHGGIIGMGNTVLDEKLNIRTDSLIHSAVKDGNNVKVEVIDELEKIEHQDAVTAPGDNISKSERRYPQLNKIYRSIISSGNNNINAINPTVTAKPDELDYDTDVSSDIRKYQLGNLLTLLNDIYANNPYAFSHDLSKESLKMFSDAVFDTPFRPYEKHWMIYGGTTHNKNEITDTYYGKHLHEFDLKSFSNDVEIESKLFGAYALAEYGNSDSLSTGVILGGNKASSDFGNGSSLDGNIAYLGGYFKKYNGNWTTVGGLGIQYSEYEAKRIADNLVQSFDYKNDYSDLGMNLYLGTKYNYQLSDNYFLEPNLKLEYTYVKQESISEKNKDLAIDVDSKEFNSLDGKIGLDIKKVKVDEKKKSTLRAGISYSYNFKGDEDQYLTGRMKGGYDFDILSPNKENDRLNFNIGYEVEKENGWVYNIKGTYGLTAKGHNSVREDSDTRNQSDRWSVGIGIGFRFNDVEDFAFTLTNLFDFDKYNIKPEGRELIKEKTKILNEKNIKGTLVVEGHTDWVGTDEYNQKLSERRAEAVKNELKNNIEKAENIQYKVTGYGESKPVADNKTKEGRAKNRRVEVKYEK